VQDAPFPTPSSPENKALSAAFVYINSLVGNIRSAESTQTKKKAKGKQSAFDPQKPKKLTIYIAKEFPTWQQKYIDALRESYDEVSPLFLPLANLRNQTLLTRLV